MRRVVNRMRAVHPGEVLREEYLAPLSLSVNALAMALGVPATRIHEIVKERRGITADTAERLARYFGGDAASWLALQADYDLKTLATRDDIARKVSPREVAPAQQMAKLLEEFHQDEILLEDFMKPMGISARQQEADIDVSPSRISELVNGHRPTTADTALRLGLFFAQCVQKLERRLNLACVMTSVPPLLSCLLTIVSGWAHCQQGIVIEFLEAENQMLKDRLRGKHIRFTDAERALLARKAKAVGRKALLGLGTIVSPDTLTRWHRLFVAQK